MTKKFGHVDQISTSKKNNKMSKEPIVKVSFLNRKGTADFFASSKNHARDVIKKAFKLPNFTEQTVRRAGILHIWFNGEFVPFVPKTKNKREARKTVRFKKPNKNKRRHKGLREHMLKQERRAA